jgi:hypothetical protein
MSLIDERWVPLFNNFTAPVRDPDRHACETMDVDRDRDGLGRACDSLGGCFVSQV